MDEESQAIDVDEVEADEEGDEDEAAKNDNDDNDEGMDEAEESAEKKALMMEEIRLQKVRDIREPLSISRKIRSVTCHLDKTILNDRSKTNSPFIFLKMGIELCCV